jgi:hypothetical protein
MAKANVKEAGKTKELAMPKDKELVPGVTAIVRKSGPVAIGANEVVYKTENAYCIFDRVAGLRIAWIPAKRVKEVKYAAGAGEAKKAKKPRAKKAA